MGTFLTVALGVFLLILPLIAVAGLVLLVMWLIFKYVVKIF